MTEDTHDKVRELLEESYESYVLITCAKKSIEGKLDVKMDYSGDPVLAAYLMQSAQEYLEEEECDVVDIIQPLIAP